MEADSRGAIECLSLNAGEATVVTGNPPLLRSFNINNAALVREVPLQLPFKSTLPYGRRLVMLEEEGNQVTVVHLSAGSAEVSRFNSSSGALLLQQSVVQPWISPSVECSLTSDSLVCAEAPLGLLFWLPLARLSGKDAATESFLSVSLQSLGVTVEQTDSDCPHQPPLLKLQPVHGSRHHLLLKATLNSVLLSTASDAVAPVSGAGTVNPRALSVTEDGTVYTAVQDRQAVRISGFSLSSGAELVSRSLACEVAGVGAAVAGVRALAVQQYSRRGDGEVAVRALLVLEDDSLYMLAAPGVVWSREEALASVLAVEAVDLPVSASSVSMHDHTSQNSGVLVGLWQRVVLQTSALMTWLGHALEDSLAGAGDAPDGPPALTRDEFNLHKLLVVASAPGKILALDNWSGAVVWSVYLPSVRPLPSSKLLLFLQRTVAHFPHPAQMALVAMQKDSCAGAVFTFNPLSGEPAGGGLQLLPYRISQTSMLVQNDKTFVKPVMVVDTSLGVHAFPASSEQTVLLQHKEVLFVTTRNASHLSGYSLRDSQPGALSLTPVWNSQFPPGTITGVYPKRSGDRVHSSGRVMADRSVLYKYTNPNLAVVTAQGYDHINKNTLSVYLVDLVSGAVVDWVNHARVSGPVHVMHSENWVVYTYHNDRDHRHEVYSLELFEGLTQANSSAFSSMSGGSAQAPIVERKAYILPHGVQASGTTVTEKSITTKYLLLALKTGGVAQVARWLVDPRRPLSSGGPREEGLMPYAPEVPLPPTEIISYNQTLPRVTGIYSASTGLESTCIVFVYGLDLFFSRVFPSKMFDMLKDDFDYFLIVGVVLSLTIAAGVTRKLAQRKALYQLWK